MAYNRVNKLRMYKLIVELTKQHYVPELTTYKGVWRTYIYPVYPISYSHYMTILGTPNLEHLLDQEERRHGRYSDPAQGSLF